MPEKRNLVEVPPLQVINNLLNFLLTCSVISMLKLRMATSSGETIPLLSRRPKALLRSRSGMILPTLRAR